MPPADGTLVKVPGIDPATADEGLPAVLSARQLGAGRTVLMGRHQARTDLGREYGATDVVAERGEDGVNAVLELTNGGAGKVLEAVGHLPAYEQAVGVVRPGKVFDRTVSIEDTPQGYAAMDAREALKVMIKP